MTSELSHRQLSLLRAVAAGKVAWRYHLRCGWAIRRTDVRSGGRGGALGAKVNAGVEYLARRGLVEIPERSGVDDTPIQLTALGRSALDSADPEYARARGGHYTTPADDDRWPRAFSRR